MKTTKNQTKTTGKITFPFTFQKNGRTGKIYKLGNGTFATKFTFAGKRIQNTFGTAEKAVEFLDSEFVKLDDDRANSLSLNPLNGDVKNYAELEQLLRAEGGGASLREAVTFFLAHSKTKKFTPQTFDYCFASFLERKELDNISAMQIKSIKKHCGRFAKDFGKRLIHDITSLEITDWLITRKDEDSGRLWSTKTRTNVRGSLVSLALFSQRIIKAIPDMGETEFQKVTIPKPDKKEEVEIYSADAIKHLLLTAIDCDVTLIPSIALGCFAGLRPAEFHAEGLDREPLNWNAFNWQDGTLHITGQKVRSKATRDIPITANLKAWLEPFVEQEGVIWKFVSAHTKKLIALREEAGTRSIYDGFRHSYASYRIRQLKQNLAQLAGEMGNSPAEIVNSYKKNVKDEDANKWFSVMPPAGYAEKIREALILDKEMRAED